MPKSILMLMEAPFASGVPKVTVPDDQNTEEVVE